jgi:hypothetical protein
MRNLKPLKCDFGGGRFDMRYAKLTLKLKLHLVRVQQPNSFLKLYIKQLKLMSMLLNCTTVMKEHCITNCFQTNHWILKKQPAKQV